MVNSDKTLVMPLIIAMQNKKYKKEVILTIMNEK